LPTLGRPTTAMTGRTCDSSAAAMSLMFASLRVLETAGFVMD
jgi:hypothetical protein